MANGREHSSAGRASALQAGGHRFEPYCSHHYFLRHCKLNFFMREWLSGRALPCQGKCREFDSRFPLHFFIRGNFFPFTFIRRHSQVVRLGSAKPSPPVRIWVAPPICRDGEIGRRKGLKIPRWQHHAGSSPAPGTK